MSNSPRLRSLFSLSRGRLLLVAVALALAAALGYLAFTRFSAGNKSTAPRRLAILPFRNLRPDAETDFLGFSLADAVITKLGYVSNLIIRPSSYVSRYRNRAVEPARVADELNVNTLLMGSYLREGDNLRVTAQLIDVTSNQPLWAEKIDLKYENLLSLEDCVTEQIIGGLNLMLTPAESDRLRRDRPQRPEAYEYYLRGVDLYSANNFRVALQMFDKAVALDPGFALAWAHRGRTYNASGSFDFGGREAYRKAQEDFDKALSLNPDLIDAVIFKANLLTDTGRVEQSVPLLREAIKSHPQHAEAHWELGYAYRFAGMLKEAIAEGERARQIDPQVKITSSAFNSYFYDGQYQKFLDSLPPREDNSFVLFYRGLGRYYLGQMQAATADFDRAFALDPSMYTQIGKALGYEAAGRRDSGLELLRDTERRIEASGVNDPEGIYKLAQGYAVLGDKAAALRVLRKSIEGGFFCYPYFTTDPLLKNLRGEQEYASLVERARERHEEFRRKFF
ncbi:MAG TPA: tetratricopeptide repeat protein [Blastocatellia bacterium]|nr:tetratricopeptide repeat protein [Blastocatellia bacterium]